MIPNYGYPNYGYPYNQQAMNNVYQSNQLQQNQTLQPQQANQNEIPAIMVDNDAAVEAYPVGMGNTVILMDYKRQKFWIKTSDGVTPKITEHEFKITSGDDQPEAKVSREEFDALSKNVEELKKFMDDLK